LNKWVLNAKQLGNSVFKHERKAAKSMAMFENSSKN